MHFEAKSKCPPDASDSESDGSSNFDFPPAPLNKNLSRCIIEQACNQMKVQNISETSVDVVLFLKQITTWILPEIDYERSFKEVLGYSSCSGIY